MKENSIKKTLGGDANYFGNKKISKIYKEKKLTDGAIRNVKEFDRSAEVREDEGDAAYHTS